MAQKNDFLLNRKIFHLKEIKKLHDFKFDDDGLEVKRIAGIGYGKYINLEGENVEGSFHQATYVYDIVNAHQLENFRPKRKTIHPLERGGRVKIEGAYEFEDEEDVDSDGAQSSGAVFSCTNLQCTAQFLRYDRLENHLLSGQCKIKVPVMTMEETVKTMYLSAFGVGFSEKIADFCSYLSKN